LSREGEGEKQNKESTTIIFFLIPKILPVSKKIKSQLPLANIFFLFSFKSSDVLPHSFWELNKKKDNFFYWEHMQDLSLQKSNPMQPLTTLYTYIATLLKKDLELTLIYCWLAWKNKIYLHGKTSWFELT
jgi:hypothetical protein